MGYIILNQTDGIMASPEIFSSKKKAKEFAEDFRKSYEEQGYYLTGDRRRIDPDDIKLQIKHIQKEKKLDEVI